MFSSGTKTGTKDGGSGGDDGGGTPLGAIVGGVIAGVMVIIIVIVLALLLYRRRRALGSGHGNVSYLLRRFAGSSDGGYSGSQTSASFTVEPEYEVHTINYIFQWVLIKLVRSKLLY